MVSEMGPALPSSSQGNTKRAPLKVADEHTSTLENQQDALQILTTCLSPAQNSCFLCQ